MPADGIKIIKIFLMYSMLIMIPHLIFNGILIVLNPSQIYILTGINGDENPDTMYPIKK